MSIENILSSLSTSEKLDAMNFLWQDLSENPNLLPSPEWHRDVVVERSNNPSSEPTQPLNEAIETARSRLNARRSQG